MEAFGSRREPPHGGDGRGPSLVHSPTVIRPMDGLLAAWPDGLALDGTRTGLVTGRSPKVRRIDPVDGSPRLPAQP